jgi:hypothetical protein
VIRAVFTARRDLRDPQVLSQAIIDYVGIEAGKAQQLAQLYLAQEIWDASGEYTLEAVQASLDFFQENGDVPLGLSAEDVADLSYYEAVLDEIGRQ